MCSELTHVVLNRKRCTLAGSAWTRSQNIFKQRLDLLGTLSTFNYPQIQHDVSHSIDRSE